MEGKCALVTGGSRGIGRAIVEKFIAEGAKVAFTYVGSAEAAQAVVEGTGQKAIAIQADATDHARAQIVVEETANKFGRLDVLVNNAGITRDNLILRMSEAQWDEVMAANLKGAFNYAKAAAKIMLKQRSGSMIHIGSIVGIRGNAGQANYAASKAGLIAFSHSLARELASRNIRSNVVAPGFIATEMTAALPEAELKKWLENIPLGRPGKTEEVAELCAFLASDKSAYITAQVIAIDGGMR
ncbi:MAG: 3-oxoacyl-[acyl-carrier-protein] reductase [Bacteroidia bacterium]|nr:3-oxoacyl-[acyl-carrier-protein] reductase [Bacteroidia bacterium]MDW8335063.1 3-oxoacyl-[acyl-carrier-protein] reductase [Bacteroidia bacterium]